MLLIARGAGMAPRMGPIMSVLEGDAIGSGMVAAGIGASGGIAPFFMPSMPIMSDLNDGTGVDQQP